MFFRANVQYGDWNGTVAADGADISTLESARPLDDYVPDGHFLVGIRVFIGENTHGRVETPSIALLSVPASDYDEANTYIANNNDPLELTETRVNLSLTEFMSLFKRFSIVMSWQALNLADREYVISSS